MAVYSDLNFFGDVSLVKKSGGEWAAKYKAQLEKNQYVGAYSYEYILTYIRPNKHMLTVGRDFKPYLIGAQWEMGKESTWELLFKRK